MTIKQQGGIFGRNPTFNEVDIEGTLSAETVDINGGTIDGTAIGGTTPAAIIGTAMEASSLGIGTTPSGGVKLDVVGTLRSTISGGTPALYLNNGTTQNSITNTSGSFSFSTGAVERLRIDTSNVTVSTGNLVIGTSGKGIDFSATSGTGTSELFDDYEEGTWTPEITGTSTAGTIAYNAQHGYYTKIGRMVQVEFYVQWNSGTGTGNLQITGLPFTAGNNLTQPGLAIGDIENVALTAANVATLAVASNSTNINMRQVPTGGGGSSPVPYDAAGYIKASGVYSV